MERTHGRPPRIYSTLGVAALSLMVPAMVLAGDRPWQLRASVISMDSSASSVEVGGADSGVSISTDVGGGLGIGLEYQLSRRLGLDLGVLAAAPRIGARVDIGWGGLSVGTGVTVAPITAGLNVHLTPDSRADVYAGPFVAYVRYSSFDVDIWPGVDESFSSGTDLGLGANLGVDVRVGHGRWSISAALKYIDTTLEATPDGGETGTVAFDPIIFGLGVAYRF